MYNDTDMPRYILQTTHPVAADVVTAMKGMRIAKDVRLNIGFLTIFAYLSISQEYTV